MQSLKKLSAIFIVALFVSAAVPWQSWAQGTKSGVVNSRDKILGASPAEKGRPSPLPCSSKNNPKCDTVSPSKPGDRGNNGLGNGIDPQPPGNPPINDASGTPGNPGAGGK